MPHELWYVLVLLLGIVIGGAVTLSLLILAFLRWMEGGGDPGEPMTPTEAFDRHLAPELRRLGIEWVPRDADPEPPVRLVS